MPLNTQEYKEPSKPEVKSTIKSETKKNLSKELSHLKDKIIHIFDKRGLTDEPTKKTFQDFASLEIPQEEILAASPSETDTQSGPEINTGDISEHDQVEIKQITESIKKTTAEAPKSPEQTLFLDRPSLYDQHRQEYDQEKKTIKGRIARHQDISIIKKYKIEKPSEFYDALRSCGVSRKQVHSILGQTSKLHGINLPKYIDYLYSINLYDENTFNNQDEKPYQFFNNIQSLKNKTNEQLNQIKELPNIFPNIDSQIIQEVVSDTRSELISPEGKLNYSLCWRLIISSKTEKYKFNPELFNNFSESEQKTVLIASQIDNKETKIHLLRNPGKIDSYIDHDLLSSKFLEDIVADKFIFSERYEEFNTFIHSELVQKSISAFPEEDKVLWNNISRLIEPSSEIAKSITNQQNKTVFFNQEHQPTSDLFKYLVKSNNNFTPKSFNHDFAFLKSNLEPIISSFSESDQQLWLGILNLPNINSTEIKHIFDSSIPYIYFNKDHQPTSQFFSSLLSGFYDFQASLTPEVLASFSPEDQKFWQGFVSLKEMQYPASHIILKYKSENIFNENGQPTSLFFEKLIQEQFYDTNFFQANLTPEVLASFSPEDQKFWNEIPSLKMLSSRTFEFIVNHKDQVDSFFNQDQQPTSLFFEELVKENYYDVNFLQASLTPEVLASFSPEDQKFWQSLISLKKNNYLINKLILKYKSGNIFNENGQPTSLFFEELVKENYYDVNFFQANLTPEVLGSFSPEDQKFWNEFLSLKKLDTITFKFIVEHRDQTDSFFNQDQQPTSLFFEKLIQEKFYDVDFFQANLTPEVLGSFSPEDQKFWHGVTNLKSNQSIDYYNLVNFLIPNKENISQYFNNDHQPSKKLIQIAINDLKADFRFVKDMVSPEFINDSDFNDKVFFNLLSKIDSPETYRFFIETSSSISQKIISSPNPENYLEQYLSVIDQINSSPAKEILKIKNQLFIEILNTSNPLETYQKISDIFIKNNLPMVGKIYRVFDALYPSTKVKEVLSNPKLSRVLINSHSSHLRQSIIFNDLLKVNLGSGELSLVNYLTFLNQSASVLEKSRLGSPLSPSETHQLSFFFRKLDTLYDSSLLSRLKPQKPFDTSTLQTKVSELYQKYNVKEGQSISDRVAEMYLSGLGIKTIPEALSYIKQSKESAHIRNLGQTEFSLSPGDLIKGVKPENLGNILNFGCVAGEYLGSDAGSDATPFDTDTIKSDQEYAISDYQKIAATGYGDLFIVVKDRGQLQDTTDTASPKYDQSKLEIFKSGVVGQQHYGVRTGFPSSEIDFLITKSTDPKILENTFYEIAKHGVYIPVLNGEGQQIFTPTDYQRYRHSFDGVKQFSGDPLEIQKSQASDPFYQEIINLKKSLQLEPVDSVSIADSQIREKIKTIFDSLGISFKDQFDTSILGARLYNIGSSGRHTNLPGDFDFDYNIVLDTPNYSKLNDIINEIKKQFPYQGEIDSIASQIRLTGVNGIGSEPIDLDIGLNTTASTLIFASHEAIEQKLDSIKGAYGEDVYQEVVANILLAKKILKENHAYKKGEKLDGGFGGIGTENWILSNNGSIKKSFDTFWQAAHDHGRELTLDEFKKRYFILDPGENLRDTGRNHDNFIFALQDKGYKAMLTAIGKYVSH